MVKVIKDAQSRHWVYKAPMGLRPYLQLSRLDRPVGYWLLTLPGWIGLAFASLSHGLVITDLKWAILILIGAIAMRGAGCTYNDIVDQDLDAQVDRTALRPLPAGTVSTKQAWIWLFAQCAVGLIVLLCLPRLAQIISLCSIPLVAAYPFMKRITWWPQLWLGMTFNWAVLVAYSAKTGELSPALLVLYLGLMFWTVGYDTIYACQDIEDDAMIGVKSTARRFGKQVKLGVGISYILCLIMMAFAVELNGQLVHFSCGDFIEGQWVWGQMPRLNFPSGGFFMLVFFSVHLLIWQVMRFNSKDGMKSLELFKSNGIAAFCLILPLLISSINPLKPVWNDGPCMGINAAQSGDDVYRPIHPITTP